MQSSVKWFVVLLGFASVAADLCYAAAKKPHCTPAALTLTQAGVGGCRRVKATGLCEDKSGATNACSGTMNYIATQANCDTLKVNGVCVWLPVANVSLTASAGVWACADDQNNQCGCQSTATGTTTITSSGVNCQ